MNAIEIDIEYRRKDFEEIYFRNKQGDLFFSPARLKYSITASAFLIASVIGISLNLGLGFSISFFFVPFVLFLVSFSRLMDMVKPVRAWKKKTLLYLEKLEKTNRNRVILTDHALSFVEDDKETIEPWSNIKKAILGEDWIELRGKSNYVFPKKSMSIYQYAEMRSFISERMKTGAKVEQKEADAEQSQ